jgi:hypothetical protein
MVTGGEEGDVRVWDIKMREMVAHLKEHNSAVTGVCILEDDAHALTGAYVCMYVCMYMQYWCVCI